MLVLARRANQSILIGKDVRVTVLQIEGNEVKLGINAPRDISILRQEIVDAITEENIRALRTARRTSNVPIT